MSLAESATRTVGLVYQPFEHVTPLQLTDVIGFVSSFGTRGVPETFVINRKGQIQALQRFPITAKWLEETLPRILAEKA